MEVRGFGHAVFAGMLLLVGGVLNVIYGIAAIDRSRFFTQNGKYIFSDLRGWGWITLILGILEIIAALSLFRGGAFGRAFGIAVASLAAIGALLSIPAAPFWSLALFALSLWIIHGLAVYEEPQLRAGALIARWRGRGARPSRPSPTAGAVARRGSASRVAAPAPARAADANRRKPLEAPASAVALT